MFGFGNEHLNSTCIGINKVEIIFKGAVDLCHFFALDYTKNTAIIVVHNMVDPIWVLIHGHCSPNTVVWNLFDQVLENVLEVVSPFAGVEKRV